MVGKFVVYDINESPSLGLVIGLFANTILLCKYEIVGNAKRGTLVEQPSAIIDHLAAISTYDTDPIPATADLKIFVQDQDLVNLLSPEVKTALGL